MIGAFYQPCTVIIDTLTLNSLPKREINAGLAEVIKYGAILDLPFFTWLEQNIDSLVARDQTIYKPVLHVVVKLRQMLSRAMKRKKAIALY